MCSYDIDNFRKFINSDGFSSVFELEPQELRQLNDDEDQLLLFAARFLKQVLYGEMTIEVKQHAREQRLKHKRQRAEKKLTESDS